MVTCPPMIGLKSHFLPLFEELGWDAYIPEFVQVMSENDLIEQLPACDGWIIGDCPATRAVFEAGARGRLKAAVKWGVGVDNVDFAACEDLGIPIINTPAMFGAEVSDIALGYVIMLARQLNEIDREVRKGNWIKPQGMSLLGKNVGVIGYGDIGKHTCDKLKAFGMNITVWDPAINADSIDPDFSLELWPDSIECCDFIIFTCALNAATHHMLNEEVLHKCKDGVQIINVARGPLICEADLISSLRSGKVKAVALDVFEEEPLKVDNELTQFSNCLFGSHNGSNTIDAVKRTNQSVIEKLYGFLSEQA